MELIHGDLTGRIIRAMIEVHRHLGPGLLENAYEECLCYELRLEGFPFVRQVALPVNYKGCQLDCSYRMDLVVDGKVLLELKAVDHLLSVHETQLLTYLRLSEVKVGLLMNFNVAVLKEGIVRRAL